MGAQYDYIAGYHLNFLTCGIAKFNVLLAKELGLPFWNLYDAKASNCKSPLLSIKLSEFTSQDLDLLPQWIEQQKNERGYGLFLHGYDETVMEKLLICSADKVYCGNKALFKKIEPLNPHTFLLWCPGTNMNNEAFKETELTVFSFGMAHKLKTDKYYILKELLQKTGKSFSIVLSTALHENTSFDDSFLKVYDEMCAIFGNRVYFQGYLSDQAVYNQLIRSDFFAAFFDDGLRANNTSVNTALKCGVAVITNLDQFSPDGLVHMRNVIDINQAKQLPLGVKTLAKLRSSAKEFGTVDLGWDKLITILKN